MLKRVLTGASLIIFVLAMIFFGATNYIYFDILIFTFATIGSFEIYKSLRKASYKNNIIPLLFLVIAIYPMWHFFSLKGLFVVFSVAIVLSLFIFTFKLNMTSKDLFATIFTLMYPYGILSLAWLLTKENCALFSIGFAIFVSVFTDTFAYFFGSIIKGKKLCPKISPKKTIAGAIGGVIGAMLCATVFFLVFEYYSVIDFGYLSFSNNYMKSLIIYLVLGLIGGMVSQLGDLAASRVKRSLNIKDFGNIFPGHGGVLDRIDSIMFMLVFLVVAFMFIY